MKSKLLVFLLIFSFSGFASSTSKYVPNVILAKLKPQFRGYLDANSAKLPVEIRENISDVNSTFPNHGFKRFVDSRQVDLSLIFTIISKNGKEKKLVHDLMALEVFEYVERKKIQYVDFTPNDSEISKQPYLAQINAYNAWDFSQGSTTVKVGIIDTGTDMDHPDLESEMSQNTNDPINGIDDDGDGYIDNFNGWDFIDEDHVPQAEENDHGVHVAGIVAAKTNNAEGVASIGFNTQFMPVRVGNGRAIIYGYEGIVYAADQGCDIINCSWGSFGASQFEEDIINYATYNKNALVVCAAGNQGQDRVYYPAGYENAFAVASVNSSDQKSSFSNYGYWIDICAPGENVYSTVDDGGYNNNTGTSMASPVVAGAAALVKAVYPQLSAKQIRERLKTTATDISGNNAGIEMKIGAGRLNVAPALNGLITNPSIDFENVKISNQGDEVFKEGDSLFISGTFTNYLAPSGNVTATMTSTSSAVILSNTVLNLGVFGSGTQKDNLNEPFSLLIQPGVSLNEPVELKIEVTDGTFTNVFMYQVLVNVDYRNIAINRLFTSMGSKGQIGFNDRSNNQGYGIQLDQEGSQLYEGGVMIGTGSLGFPKVVDRIRAANGNFDDDFSVVSSIVEVNPAPEGDYFVSGWMADSVATADSIGLDVQYSSYAFDKPGHENYVIVEYTVVNRGIQPLTDLAVGIFADFDIWDYSKNKVLTSAQHYMTYSFSTELGSPYFGIQLIDGGVFNTYALDNVSGGNGGVDITDGYYPAEKLQTLTTERATAGAQNGQDVIQITSAREIGLLPGDTQKVVFAIIGAESEVFLFEAADSAYYGYHGMLPNSINELAGFSGEVYPNPASDWVRVSMPNAFGENDYVIVRDVTGKSLGQFLGIAGENEIELDFSPFKNGVYLVEIHSNKGVETIKLIKN